MEENNKKTNWSICLQCQGRGKIAPRVHKKKRGASGSGLDISKSAEVDQSMNYINICTSCTGSGLVQTENTTPVNNEYPRIAIVGGGIGGAALAAACLHRGIPFTLYERDSSFGERSQGYGLTLQQASNAMSGLGIESLKKGVTSTLHKVHDLSGKVIGEWGMRKWLQIPVQENTKRKNVHIARQTLRAMLLNQLHESSSIKWGHGLRDFSKNESSGFDLDFQVGVETRHTQADLIVGADGIRSVVRNRLIGEDQTPLRYLGCIVMLGICPLEKLQDTTSELLDGKTVFQTVNGHERIYMMPYDANTIMWQLSFPISEKSAKDLSARGTQAMKDEALERLKDWHSPVPQILNATDTAQITGYPVYDRALLNPELLHNAGDATLIGDACHPMSPFKGQGANQALLDALALVRAISIHCGPGSNWREVGLRKSILNQFETDMLERTASKVTDSAKAVELLHSDAVLHEGDEPRGRGIK